jgi:MFS family permease
MLWSSMPLSKQRPMALVSLALLLYWSSLYVYVPILPVYARALGASLTLVGLIVGSYGLAQLVLRIPIGVTSDRLARRRPFAVAGFAAAVLSGISLVLAPSAEWLLLGRTLAGVSAATWVVISVIFAGYFPAAETTRAMGLASFLSGAGQLIATSTGGKIAELYGWHAPFVAGAVLALAGGLVMLLIRDPEAQRRSVAPGWAEIVRVGTRPRLLAVSAVAALGQYTFWATSYAFVPIYASNLHYAPAQIGLLTTAMLIAYTAASLGLVRLARVLDDRVIICGGLVLAALSPLLTPFVTGYGLLLAVQALGGLGRGVAFPSLMGASLAAVTPRERGTAMGVYQAVYALGMTLGPATAGVIADRLGVSGALWISGLVTLLATAVAGLSLAARPRPAAVMPPPGEPEAAALSGSSVRRG